MKVKVEAGQINGEMVFMSLGNAETLEPKLIYGSDDVKTIDGKPLFRVNLKAIRLVDGQPEGEEQGVSLSVLSQIDTPIRLGQLYQLGGQVQITHYVTASGRLGVSLIADRIVPVQVGRKPE